MTPPNIKRAFDLFVVTFSLPFLIVSVPILAFLVLVFLGRPVLFRQQRTGLSGHPFELIKFRTMTDGRGAGGVLKSDSERLTRFGSLLRASSLDELPEFWNVLRGEMSIVGPRPLLPDYLPLYSPEQARRHEVRPGITGLAQVSGRNALSWERRFELDVWYVDNQTTWIDLKIIILTFKLIFNRDGINAQGEATMRRFTGSK